MCNCPACNRSSVVPLPRDKWVIGQRIRRVYHFPMRTVTHCVTGLPVHIPDSYAENTGTIIPSPFVALPFPREGFYYILDNGTELWAWDFMIASGIGCYSPIMEARE